MQEFEAAKAAILKVKPDANVIANRVDAYPITVTVTAGGRDVWSGRQQLLFRKNGRPAMKDIEQAMKNV
jgi:hypothetical protein